MSWFIPPEFDDGFTMEGPAGPWRPMLHRQRAQLTRQGDMTDYEVRVTTLRPPWALSRSATLAAEVNDLKEEARLDLAVKSILSYSSAQEAADYCELRDGFSLFFEHPGMACMSCKVCHEIIVDIDKGVPYIPTGGSEPVYRPPNINVPCDAGRTCPKGHWSKPKGFSKLCEQVWRHYWMMKAAGKTAPDCPIIHRNWALIDWIIGGKRANLNPMAVGST